MIKVIENKIQGELTNCQKCCMKKYWGQIYKRYSEENVSINKQISNRI